jgi:hypothetical protein
MKDDKNLEKHLQENLQHITEARKVAYDVFMAFDEEEKRKKRLHFWKGIIKFFLLSLILLIVISLITKILT